MNLAVVSSRFPDEPTEAYLGTELAAWRPHVDRLLVVPALHRTTRHHAYDGPVVRYPLLGATTLRDALTALARRPRAALEMLAEVLFAPRVRFRHRIKNLAVYPKGLAVGTLLLREKIDHVHAYWLSTPATIAMIGARVAGIPWTATGHRWDIYDDNAIARKASSASLIRTISARGREDVRSRVAPRDRERVILVPLGVRVPERLASLPDRETFTVLCAAELLPVKGHGILLDAIAAARAAGADVRAVLCGEGPLREKVAQRVADLGLAKVVRIEGAVPHDLLLRRLEAAEFDAVALASIAQGDVKEGIPVILIEAMAAGIPVIATDSGSIPELIDESRGVLVAQGNVQAYAKALVALCGDHARRAALATNARAFVAGRYDVTMTARDLLGAIAAQGSTDAGTMRLPPPASSAAAGSAQGS